MAKGKKYSQDVIEKAYAMFAVGDSYSHVSEVLGIPKSTVRGWRKQMSNADREEDLAQLRTKKKEEFVNNAWDSIGLAQQLLERRLRRALEQEDTIDLMMDQVDAAAREMGLTQEAKRGLVTTVSSLRCDDIGKIATILGVLYDKQALASKEETEILGGSVDLKRFEDY